MSVVAKTRKMLDTEKWDELMENCSTGTILTASWYIDILSNHNWLAYISVDDHTGQWLAAIPVFLSNKMQNVFSRQPLLSKYWGVHVRQKATVVNGAYEQIHFEKAQMALLLEKALNVAVFDYFSGINPVYVPEYQWQNVSLGTRFTYTIDLGRGIEQIRTEYAKTVRKKTNKLRQDGFVNRLAINSKDLEEMLVANIKAGKNLIPANAIEPLKKLSKKAYEKDSGFFLSTYSAENELAAAGFFLYNKRYTHFISGYVHPKFRQQNAMNLLVDGALNRACGLSQKFDFFGSSIESIESFFRSFGSVPEPYYRLIKAKFPFNLIWKI